MNRFAIGALALVASLGLLVGCSSGGGGCCGVCQEECVDPCDPCAGRPAGIPAEAKPGEAWCRYYVPPQFEEEEYQVCVCPESCKRTWVPPVYEDQERQVCCKPAQTICHPIPAVFEDQTEEVCCCPARTEWRKVDCTPKMLEEGQRQGDCWMLVEIPAKYRTVTRRVCVTPASSKTETIPPEYKTVTEKVMVKPGYYETETIEAKYETRTRRICKAPGRWEWRRNEDCDVPPEAAAEEGAAEAEPAAEGDGGGGA